MISKDDVEKVAHLARLEVKQDKVEAMKDHFNNIINHFNVLQQLNTEGLEPMVTPHEIFSELRKDHISKSVTVEKILENAPETKDSLFKVPPVV